MVSLSNFDFPPRKGSEAGTAAILLGISEDSFTIICLSQVDEYRYLGRVFIPNTCLAVATARYIMGAKFLKTTKIFASILI